MALCANYVMLNACALIEENEAQMAALIIYLKYDICKPGVNMAAAARESETSLIRKWSVSKLVMKAIINETRDGGSVAQVIKGVCKMK